MGRVPKICLEISFCELEHYSLIEKMLSGGEVSRNFLKIYLTHITNVLTVVISIPSNQIPCMLAFQWENMLCVPSLCVKTNASSSLM